MKNYYVLFVKTGCEDDVAGRLNRYSELKTFIPKIEVFRKKSGVRHKEIRICFRSYVFIESAAPPEEFIIASSKIIARDSEIYRILNYGDSMDIAMREEDVSVLFNFFGDDFFMEVSTGVISGDKIKITSGSLVGKENLIKKINRHKMEAAVEFECLGKKRNFYMGVEVIENIQNQRGIDE